MVDLIDVYYGDKASKMTRTRFTHPSLGEGEYVRLFANSQLGLVFREDGIDILVGLWCVIDYRK